MSPVGDDSQQAIERGAVAALDVLLTRIASASGELRDHADRDAVDSLVVRRIAADVSVVAGLLRALNAATTERLKDATRALQHAREDLIRSSGAGPPSA